MSENEATKNELDWEALEAFVVDNADLERLEALLDRFNIFEAIGVVRQELRHSDFLAFLLNPQENHGLGDAFVKRLLQQVRATAEDTSVPLTPIDLELWNLNRIEVLREWQHIDILLLDKEHKLAIIIENKIGTSEHSDQLRRYHRIVEQHHPSWGVFGLYLTPGGDTPSEEEIYLPVDYGLVCNVIDSLVENRALALSPDVQTLMTHYTEMLRRHIVDDSEIAQLCSQIYRKHRRALDLIYEHRPDTQIEIKDAVQRLVEDEPKLVLDDISKTRIRFTVKGWDRPPLLTAEGWTSSGRILMFEFWNSSDDLRLKLMIGPGSDEVRHRLFDMAHANEVFRAGRNLRKHSSIFTRRVLKKDMYDDATASEREGEILRHWAEFVEHDLPRLDAVLKQERWIWEQNVADESV